MLGHCELGLEACFGFTETIAERPALTFALATALCALALCLPAGLFATTWRDGLPGEEERGRA